MTARSWLSTFAVALVLAASAMLAGLFQVMAMVARPDYPEQANDPALRLQDLIFSTRNRSCDILIDGDSSAGVGLDPSLITARTGLTACNIATNRAIVDALDTLPLDAFLAHNPRPRLIVFQFSPEVFYRAPSRWQHNDPYSPLVLLSRNVPRRQALGIMLSHPAQTSQFVLSALHSELVPNRYDRRAAALLYRTTLDYAAQHSGQFYMDSPPIPDCGARIPRALYGPVDNAWINALHARYESRGIPVLVRPAPIPTCDPQFQQFQRDLAPAPANQPDGPLEPLPVEDFIAGYRHTTPAGAQPETLSLLSLIQSRYPTLITTPPPEQYRRSAGQAQ